jgi:hypothetical protein
MVKFEVQRLRDNPVLFPPASEDMWRFSRFFKTPNDALRLTFLADMAKGFKDIDAILEKRQQEFLAQAKTYHQRVLREIRENRGEARTKTYLRDPWATCLRDGHSVSSTNYWPNMDAPATKHLLPAAAQALLQQRSLWYTDTMRELDTVSDAPWLRNA